MWIYRYARPPQMDVDDPQEQDKKEQYSRLKAFVAGSRAADGSLRFGLNDFLHDQQFTDLVREHLKQFVRKAVPVDGPEATPALSAVPAMVVAPVSAAELADRLDHLIHLCDREDVCDLFTEKMRQWVKHARPGAGILCVLPGGKREGHRGFLQRVRDYEMRNQISGVTPEQVALVPVGGKLSLATPETLGISILRGLRDGVLNPDLDSWRDLQRWMTAHQRRIFILALEPTSEVIRGKERLSLDNAAAWLGTWLDKPARHLFVLIACVRYAIDEGSAGAGERAPAYPGGSVLVQPARTGRRAGAGDRQVAGIAADHPRGHRELAEPRICQASFRNTPQGYHQPDVRRTPAVDHGRLARPPRHTGLTRTQETS